MSISFSQPSDGVMAEVLGENKFIDGVPIGKKMSRKQLSRASEAMARFEKAVGKDSHCIVIAGPLGYRDPERKQSTEKDIIDSCRRHFKRYPGKAENATISVILDSFGGSLDSAFRSAVYLRRFATRVEFYVPRRAKSAATLMTLGGDLTWMSPFAELGPLDTQIKDPRNPSKSISALDCYQSVDYVQKFALDTIPKVLGVLLRETEARLPLSDLVEMAATFTWNEVSPLFGQVRALDFGGWGRTLRIGELYARVLQMRLGREVDEMKAGEIADKLVYGFTHHPYPVDVDEARRIGLRVDTMAEDKYLAALELAEACEDSRCVGFKADIDQMTANLSGALGEGEQDEPSTTTRSRKEVATQPPAAVAYVGHLDDSGLGVGHMDYAGASGLGEDTPSPGEASPIGVNHLDD